MLGRSGTAKLTRRAIVAAVVLVLAAFAGLASAGGETRACELVAGSRVQAIVHLASSTIVRNASNLDGTAGDPANELPEDVHSECDFGLWNGATPTSLAAVVQRARAGNAAQVGIATWEPNGNSPNVKNWDTTGYQETTANLLKARHFLMFGIPGSKVRALNPTPLAPGHLGAGEVIAVSGIGQGLVAAVGCWWSVKDEKIICLLDEEARGKPVVNDLGALAKVVVTNFLG